MDSRLAGGNAGSMRHGDVTGSANAVRAAAARKVAAAEAMVTRGSSNSSNRGSSTCSSGTAGIALSPQHFRRCLRVLERAGAGPTVSEGTKYYEIAADGKPQVELLLLLRLATMPKGQVDEVELAALSEMEGENGEHSGSDSDSGSEDGISDRLVKIAGIVCRVGDSQSIFQDVKSNEGRANSDCMTTQLITLLVASSLTRVISLRNEVYSFNLPIDLRLAAGSETCLKTLNAARLRVTERYVLLRCIISYSR